MTTATVLGFLLAAAASGSPRPAELCVIAQPVDYIRVTDPAKTVATHCGRPTEAERAAVADVDGTLLRRGTYHLFIVPNEGPVRIEWTGQATGTQIFVGMWNGKAFEISDLRGEPETPVTHRLDVRRPASQGWIYVLVNSPNGSIATDGLRVHAPGTYVSPTKTRRRATPERQTHIPSARAPLYWASCRSDNKAVLIASSSAQGIAAALEHDLESLATELAGVTWYPAPAEGAGEPRAARRFGAPTVIQEDALHFLALGECETPGVVYSTTPVTEPELPTPAYSEQTLRAMRRTARSLVGRKLGPVDPDPAPDGQVGLRLCQIEGETSCFGWMLLDAKRRPRRVAAAAERTSWLALANPQTNVGAASWLRPRAGSRYWVGLIRWEASSSECDGETCGALMQDGLWLVWMSGAKVEVVKVIVRELAA